MPMARPSRAPWQKRREPFYKSPRPRACRGCRVLSSVQLSRLMGPVFPMPVLSAVLAALASVEVQVQDVGQSGFQLTFSIDKQSPLQILFLLTRGMPLLLMRVVIVAT